MECRGDRSKLYSLCNRQFVLTNRDYIGWAPNLVWALQCRTGRLKHARITRSFVPTYVKDPGRVYVRR